MRPASVGGELSGEHEGARVAPRYQRNLGSLGRAAQGRLFAAHILVVGLGGLGGYVIEQLARCGVGQITGVDPDVFDATNLNRQLLATTSTLGQHKVAAARDRLALVNPDCRFCGIVGRHPEVPETVWAAVDLVFDCLDSIEDRLDLAARCTLTGRTLIHGAVAGWYGQVAVVWPGQDTVRMLYPQSGPGWEQDLGTPPFTVGLTGSLMVAQGIKVLSGTASPSHRQVDFLDIREGRWCQTVL